MKNLILAVFFFVVTVPAHAQTGHIGEADFWRGYNAAGGRNGGGDAYIDGLIRSGQLPPLPTPTPGWHHDPVKREFWRPMGSSESFDPNSLPVDFYKFGGLPVPAGAGGTYVTDPPLPGQRFQLQQPTPVPVASLAPRRIPQVVSLTPYRAEIPIRFPVAPQRISVTGVVRFPRPIPFQPLRR